MNEGDDDLEREALGEQEYIHALKSRIELGMDAQAFLKSELGRYLLQRSDQDVVEGLRDLRAADPTDTRAVIAAQTKCDVAERWLKWFIDAINTGKNAETNFINTEAQSG